MKKLALIFTLILVVIVCACEAPKKEVRKPISGTTEYLTYSLSEQPELIGIKNAQMKVVIPNVYTEINYVGDRFVCKDSKGYHLLSTDNKVIFSSSTPLSYNEEGEYFATEEKSGTTIYFPQMGSFVTGKFDNFVLDTLGNVCILQNKKYGVVNKDGRQVIDTKHEAIKILNNKYVVLDAKKDGTSIYDKNGKINWKNVNITSYTKFGIKEDNAPKQNDVKKLF